MKGSRNTSGFILLDMLVSLPILVFLLAAMGAMAVMAFRAAFFMMADSELQQEVQMAVRQVAEDARTSYAIRGFTKDEKPGYTFYQYRSPDEASSSTFRTQYWVHKVGNVDKLVWKDEMRPLTGNHSLAGVDITAFSCSTAPARDTADGQESRDAPQLHTCRLCLRARADGLVKEGKAMGRESQQGSAVIWALLVTIFAMMLATAVCYTAYNSRKMAASYEREVTLRLAAEAALLEALQRVEKEPVLVDTGMIIAPREVETEKGTLVVQAAAEQKAGSYWLVAVAREKSGDVWQRHKIARARLEKKEDGYVWKGRSR